MQDHDIIECSNQNGEKRGVCINPHNRFYGWVFKKHPDGQWVTYRKAAEPEIRSAEFLARFDRMAMLGYVDASARP